MRLFAWSSFARLSKSRQFLASPSLYRVVCYIALALSYALHFFVPHIPLLYTIRPHFGR